MKQFSVLFMCGYILLFFACAPPSFDPEEGIFETSIDVTIVNNFKDSVIYYTLDGTAPTPSSNIYEGPISLAESTTLKAVAIKDNLKSRVAKGEYILNMAPSKDEIMGWIEDMVGFGIRRPGTEANNQEIDYLFQKFKEFGIVDVEKQGYDMVRWEADYSLKVGTDLATEVACFHMPMTNNEKTGPDGHEADMIYVDIYSEDSVEESFENSEKDIADKYVLIDVHYDATLNYPVFLLLSLPILNTISWIYDPYHHLPSMSIPGIFMTSRWMTAYTYLANHGAAGVVGILSDYPKDNPGQYNYYQTIFRDVESIGENWIPGLWVSRNKGDFLKTLIVDNGGSMQANMMLNGTITTTPTWNVVATIPGKSDDIIIVSSHHDSLWDGAVEDASGCAMVLALAKYYAGLSKQPEKTMVFLLDGSHFAMPHGGEVFIEENPDVMAKVKLEVCLEHFAKHFEVDEEDNWVDTGLNVPRFVFVSGETDTDKDVVSNQALTDMMIGNLKEHVLRYDLENLMIFNPDGVVGMPTDALPFHLAGIPVYSHITAPTYLFGPGDTLDKVAVDELNPMANAWIEIINSIAPEL